MTDKIEKNTKKIQECLKVNGAKELDEMSSKLTKEAADLRKKTESCIDIICISKVSMPIKNERKKVTICHKFLRNLNLYKVCYDLSHDTNLN